MYMVSIKFALIISFVIISQAYAYTVHISAPAVLNGTDTGTLTGVSLNVTPGNGIIEINAGNMSVGNDTVNSAKQAVYYAATYLNKSQASYNFIFTIDTLGSVSGPSAGALFTVMAIAALEHKQLIGNFTETGTINPNGTIGQIGGIFDKVGAAQKYHKKFIIVPYVYNKSTEYMLYYLSQQAYSIPLVEARNISEALQYAFGTTPPTYLNYNITADYNTSSLENASAFCTYCNESSFAELTNFTFNYVGEEINSINSSKFGALKSQMNALLLQYKNISMKGYMYTGADYAFIEYPTAFLFANYNASNETKAMAIINNIYNYCSSLNYTGQMTQNNYEYVIGGNLRKDWALVTLSQSIELLNSSQTSDGVLFALDSAAPAYGWCAAASEMYNMSYSIGGNEYISLQPKVASLASYELSEAVKKYGSQQLYVKAANYSFNNGDYATTLYSLTYANVFYNLSTSINHNQTETENAVKYALESANGIWSTQFALQSEFYLEEASFNGNSIGYMQDAYSTSLLSERLGNLNTYLNHSFSYSNNTSIQYLQPKISQELGLIFGVLVIILMALIAILIMLIVHILDHKRTKR